MPTGLLQIMTGLDCAHSGRHTAPKSFSLQFIFHSFVFVCVYGYVLIIDLFCRRPLSFQLTRKPCLDLPVLFYWPSLTVRPADRLTGCQYDPAWSGSGSDSFGWLMQSADRYRGRIASFPWRLPPTPHDRIFFIYSREAWRRPSHVVAYTLILWAICADDTQVTWEKTTDARRVTLKANGCAYRQQASQHTNPAGHTLFKVISGVSSQMLKVIQG